MSTSVAIVGAGVSGLACAGVLHDAGIETVVFDKARGVGGRTSSRRLDDRTHTIGAPFFRADDEELVALCERLSERGELERLRPAHFRSGDALEGYTHTSCPNALCQELLDALPFAARARVRALRRASSGWIATVARDFPHGFDAAVVTTPAPQARDLLVHGKPLVAPVSYAPQWVVVAESPLDVPWRFADTESDEGLRRVARFQDSWTLYGDLDWSARHFEDDPEDVREVLCAAFESTFGVPARPLSHHRWRYATPLTTVDPPWSWSDELNLGLAGDWRRLGGVQDAFVSGRALGRRIVERLG